MLEGTIPKYETENGVWLSAFHPIRNSQGKVVSVLEADVNFSEFISDARSHYISRGINMSIIILVLALGLVLYARKILREDIEQRNLLVRQKQEIEEKNREIKASLAYALKIQSAILPEKQKFECFQDHFIYYHPKDVVSGDFYWMYQTEEYTFSGGSRLYRTWCSWRDGINDLFRSVKSCHQGDGHSRYRKNSGHRFNDYQQSFFTGFQCYERWGWTFPFAV